MVLARRCIDCGTVTRNGTRCPAHAAAHQNSQWGTNYRRLCRAVLIRDGHRCQISMPGCTTVATTVDHIDPHGPRADMANLQAACGHCNSAKQDR